MDVKQRVDTPVCGRNLFSGKEFSKENRIVGLPSCFGGYVLVLFVCFFVHGHDYSQNNEHIFMNFMSVASDNMKPLIIIQIHKKSQSSTIPFSVSIWVKLQYTQLP